MTAPKGQQIAVLCDFDGTITKGGVIDLLYRAFAEQSCWELVDRWIRGEISTIEEMQGCFSTMKATREEMEAVLDRVEIDPGFPEFVDFCKERGYLLAILSDGLRWYIDYVLTHHGICDLPIYANEIHFLEDGYLITTPWYSPQTPRRGVSKPGIIQDYRAMGYKAIFIGDGLSDIEAVSAADLLYARDELLEYCQKHGFPAIAFKDMRDVISKWQEG